MYPQLIRHDT